MASSAPLGDIIEEAQRLTAAAHRDGIALKLTGGVGIYFHAPSVREPWLRREYRDLDFVGPSPQRGAVWALLKREGYEPDTPFNTLAGLRRLRYWDREHDRQVDIFLDQIQMCHTIDLRGRLHLSGRTLAPADLLLTKMQIMELNRKDLTDVVALLLDHPVGGEDGEVINATYIAGVLGRDWGFYRTVQVNMGRLREALSQFSAPTEAGRRLDALWRVIEDQPKTLRWRLRARVGDRLRWYNLPEEEGGGGA